MLLLVLAQWSPTMSEIMPWSMGTRLGFTAGSVNAGKSLTSAKIVKLNAPDVVKFTKSKVKELKSREVVKMAIREHLIEKIKSLPEDRLEEVGDFVEFLEAKGKAQSELAEYGMGDYLNQLSAYEEMLAAGKIKWR